MKIQKNNPYLYINILIYFTILIIPLYFIRIPILSISLSILTITLLILSIILFFKVYKNILLTFQKNLIFWTLTALFLLSFIPILILHPTQHGFGVFIEWLFLPVLTSFLLLVYISKYPNVTTWMKNALITMLFFLSSISIYYLIFGHITFDGRLGSIYSSPNHLAMLIAPLIFIPFATFFESNSTYKKTFSIVTIFLTLITLFFTNSFSSSMALLISALLIIFISIQKKKILLILIFTILIITALIGYHKFSTIDNALNRSSIATRYEIWTVSTNYLQQNIFNNSSGIDNFQNIFLDAQPLYKPYIHWSAPTPHNLLLTLWISGGFFTILFFCLLYSRIFYLINTSYKKTKSITLLLYFGVFLTILLTSLLDTSFWKNDLSLIFWIIIALILSKNTSIKVSQSI